MKVVGLITEYNPFHNGHLYHLKEAKKKTHSDYSIAIMSGNFLQRGEPALMDKWTRAKIAVENGVDLVIELPTFFALNSAEYFAKGAVSILDSLNIIDTIVFGSEHGHMDLLSNIASHLIDETDQFTNQLQIELKKGHSFPKARASALSHLLSDDLKDILNSPNNILGIEYIKWLKKLNSKIEVDTVRRTGTNYHDIHFENNIASATAVRLELKNANYLLDAVKQVIPEGTYTHMKEYEPFIYPESLFPYLDYLLRVTNYDTLAKIHDISEGLENRILSSILEANSYMDLVDLTKSKRYTQTRIQRVLAKALLQVTDDYLNYSDKDFEYMRILAMNNNGQALIKQIKKATEIPIITNLNKVKDLNTNQQKLLDLDIKASNLYALLQGQRPGIDYKTNPFTNK